MSATTHPLPFAAAVPPDVVADLQAIAEAVAAGTQAPPEVVRRVRDQADRNREEIFRAQGLLDIGVPAIRKLRAL